MTSGAVDPFQKSRPDALTGLRFFAALGVVIFHLNGNFGVPAVEYPLGHGVTLFFVLSGFILTYVYEDVKGPRRLRAFYIARFARVWPLHFVTFIAAIVLAVNTVFPTPFETAAIAGLNLVLLQSWWPTMGAAFSFNAVSWSLSNEAFFYALFPVLRRNLSRNWHWKLGASLLSGFMIAWATAVLSIPMTGAPSTITAEALGLVNPLSRLFQFMVGMCCCLAWMRFRHLLPRSFILASAVEIGIVIFGWWLGYHMTEMRGLDIVFGERVQLWMNLSNGLVPAFALLIIALANGNGIISRLLAVPPMVFLGEISYAIYMVHFIILVVITRFVEGLAAWPPWLALSVYLVLTLTVSTLLFLFVEKPMRNRITGRRHATS
ncbi:acyltransferase family protein [Ancylobacter mangrovi]|uniref:acyltransferase family protein n=1 Tax=Ancylobacter mangrovi TaxID=2972472 RepID=UPI002161DF4F|nr:acyltransferase [Ancylobacter mangrovi]MCS0503092.1 acyltransferase [Ancylobacter mangrovi]